MRKIFIWLAFSLFCPVLLMAQEYKRIDLFVGYQYTHFQPSLNTNGWNAGLSTNVNRWFGVKFDFSGAYKNEFKFQSYMFGPELSLRKWKAVRPFAYGLAGAYTTYGYGSSYTAFSIAVGGGLDANIGDHFAVRVVQADWLPFRAGPDWVNKNARVATGVVFRF